MPQKAQERRACLNAVHGHAMWAHLRHNRQPHSITSGVLHARRLQLQRLTACHVQARSHVRPQLLRKRRDAIQAVPRLSELAIS